MGGRLALHVALAAPERVARLVLVSATAGIEDDGGARAAPAPPTSALAAEIERMPLEDFARRWLAQPLFADDADAATARAAARTSCATSPRASPRRCAARRRRRCRRCGTGSASCEGSTTLVVAGERDAKFRALGERLAAAIPGARLDVVAGAGHALPRERPRELAADRVTA